MLKLARTAGDMLMAGLIRGVVIPIAIVVGLVIAMLCSIFCVDLDEPADPWDSE